MKNESLRSSSLRKGWKNSTLAASVLGLYALVVIVGMLFWGSAAVRGAYSGPVLLVASFSAAIVCLAVWRALHPPVNRVWLVIAAAAVFASLGNLGALLSNSGTPAPFIHVSWLLAYALVLAALIIAVHLNERGRLTELALDVALVLTAAALVIVRLAPGALIAQRTGSSLTLFLVVWAPVVALAAALLGAVLIAQKTLPKPVLIGVAGGVIGLLISAVPQVLDGQLCCRDDSWPTFAAIGAWTFLAFAGAAVLNAGEHHSYVLPRERLRQFVAPIVAIVLAAISVDAAINPPLGPTTAFVLGILGALVAIRLTELLNATRLQVAERRELAQTRALFEVSRALAGKNELDETLRTVTKWAVRVLNARAAAVELLSPDAKTLVLRAAEGLQDDAIGMTFEVANSFTGRCIINGQARVTTNAARDPFIGKDSLKLLGESPVAAMPLRYRDRLLGVLSCIGNRPFDASDLDLLRAFANQTALALEDARLFEQVKALSVTDPLTGLANRRQMDRELTREFAAAQRGRKLVAVMFDLDDFKQHNDTFGHVAGDEVLKRFADALSLTTRTMNLAARYGGDEFFSLLADSDIPGADIFVSRVKGRFHRSMEDAGAPPVRVSAGIAEFTPEMKRPEDLIEAADRALYSAKFEEDVKA